MKESQLTLCSKSVIRDNAKQDEEHVCMTYFINVSAHMQHEN